MPKSAALYLQPRHLRCIALSAHGSLMLAKVCTRVINGQVPGIIEPFLYDHKVVAFDKMSKHQADLHRREVSAALLQGEPPPKAKLRPIAIGEVMLRLAERTYARQMRTVFIRHLMPYQFGVAVPGGLSLWSTVIECMLQADHNNVFLSIDLVNCFNTMDRDMLIAECMLHDELVPLATYVKNTYPPGMMCWVEVEDAWKGIAFENGTAQGRPLSPALCGILLRPALQAAKRAMDVDC